MRPFALSFRGKARKCLWAKDIGSVGNSGELQSGAPGRFLAVKGSIMMRKMVVLAVAVAFSVALVACGGDEPATSGKAGKKGAGGTTPTTMVPAPAPAGAPAGKAPAAK